MHSHDQTDGAYCLYPPRVADGVDVTEQVEAGATRYVVRNTATARYFLLKPPEYQVFCRIDGAQPLSEISRGGRDAKGPRVSPQALSKFLEKLDSLGLIARGGGGEAEARKQERGLYIRFKLFDPDRLLARLDRGLGWAMTKPVIAASFALMIAVAGGLLMRAEEVTTYSIYTYGEYGLAAILLTTLIITALHEFAHGLACKHFGGDVREVGVLMIFYVLPALYCNVTDIHRFARKSERLWVIFAGIYWQLLVSALSALAWLLATPFTLLADLSFLIFLGGTFNIIINCNPLIKLDGYYALSQMVGISNLQARSSEYMRSVFARVAYGSAGARAPESEARLVALSRYSPGRSQHRSPAVYLSYWLLSLLYSLALIWLILGWAGDRLMDSLGFAGVLLTILLAALLTERWWKPAFRHMLNALRSLTAAAAFIKNAPRPALKGVSAMSAQPALQKEESEQATRQAGTPARRPALRRRMVKGGIALLVVAALVAPWEASTGSDCTLVLPPGREAVARANIDAVLAEIYVQPGDTVAEGAKLARLSNPELEDRLTQLNAEIERLSTNNSRIEEELRVRSEMLLSANFKETDHRRLATELLAELDQVARWSQAARERGESASPLPPSIAVLQSEIELKQTELEYNRREVDRYKRLLDLGLVGEQQYDRAVAAARLSEKDIERARARLEAAMVEHRRLTSNAQTNSLVAETEARAARSNFEALITELHANRQQLESLRQRREIAQREYDGMKVAAPRSGVILGDDLRKMMGRRYGRGEEICRIGELERFQLRIEVSEREIGNVRLDSPVRFKLKTVPGRTFTGQVSKIYAEPLANQHGQRFYPVEVVVENSDGLLRPGMTGFARISFGRQSIGLILAEKLWHALRPELWLF
jgi:putative peptide zinc metalloprotease protein